ncbi:MAG TPA: CDP-alcohol phosphatidyltransferase family protein, partial [Haliangiales bacterium]|nr:CDP-alcohol phosphatidyltransferase family protein [Haliangiales bacterium]
MVLLPGLTAIVVVAASFFLGYAFYRQSSRKDGRAGATGASRRAPSALVTHGLMEYVYWLLTPVERALLYLGATPKALTLAGLALCAAAGAFAAASAVAAAGVFYLAGGILDILDGRVARSSGKATRAGALLDSVCDRWAEFLVLGGIAFALRADAFGMIAVLVATAGSQMVSYTRARAEALGVSLAVGLMQRSERIILVGLGLLVAGAVDHVGPQASTGVLTLVLMFVGATSLVTAIRRLVIAMDAIAEPKPMVQGGLGRGG